MTGPRRRADIDDDFEFETPRARKRSGGLLGRAIDAGLRNPVMAAGTVVSGFAIIIIVTNAIANQPMRHPSPLFSTRPPAVSGVIPVTTMPIIVGENPLQPMPEAPPPAPRTQQAAQSTAQGQPQAQSQPVAVPDAYPPQAQSGPPTIPPLANLTTQLTERVQQALRDRGFYTGAVDGIAGPATTDAVRAFEQRLGVAANGDINDRLLSLLRSERGRQISARQPSQPPKPVPVAAPPPPRQVAQVMPAPVPPEPLTGSVEGRLQKVQRALNIAGYGMLRTDGRLDDKTTEAIRKFEGEHGMPITGRVSDRLLSMLVVRSAEAR